MTDSQWREQLGGGSLSPDGCRPPGCALTRRLEPFASAWF